MKAMHALPLAISAPFLLFAGAAHAQQVSISDLYDPGCTGTFVLDSVTKAIVCSANSDAGGGTGTDTGGTGTDTGGTGTDTGGTGTDTGGTGSGSLACPSTYQMPANTTIVKMGGKDNLSKVEFNTAFDNPGNRVDSRSEVGQIKAFQFDNNAYLSGKITGTAGNFGSNYKDWSVSACPGDFRDVLPPKCRKFRALGTTLYYHASDAGQGCVLPPNQPMYLNIRATDSSQAAGYAVSNVPAAMLP